MNDLHRTEATVLAGAVMLALVACNSSAGIDIDAMPPGTGADAAATDAPGTITSTDPADYRGRVLVSESFVNTDTGSRGWYDGGGAGVVAGENAPGGTGGAYACVWAAGATSCAAGRPGRHAIEPVEAAYMSFWVKHTANWVGSGRAYHPHLFHLMTNLDAAYQGPSYSRLTTYVEHVNGRAILAIQDSANTDLGCIRRNNGTFVGCNGNLATYQFTEARSVSGCNNVVGDPGKSDCFPWGDGTYYSARGWTSPDPVFTTQAGPSFQGDWHHVEAYFRLNSIENGVGIPDGLLRYWIDGEPVLAFDHVLMRTGLHPEMRFNQLDILPYIGDSSPINQTMWIDEVVVAEGAL